MHLLRRPTDPALERARNARRRPTLPSDPQPSRVQEKYPAYEDFPWEEIEKFLKLKWPLWTEFNPTMSTSHWLFEIPKGLTDADKKELRELRDAPKRKRRGSLPQEEGPIVNQSDEATDSAT